MGAGNDQIGRITIPVGGFDSLCPGGVAVNFSDFLPGDDFPSVLRKGVSQRFAESIAAPYDAEGAGVVKVGDESMGGKRGAIAFCGVER